jgi:hypothetical protein
LEVEEMSTQSIAIPYEKQSDPQTLRDCGAACLSMVYKSFGVDISPSQIWPLVAKPNRFGSVASTTHLMALHALKQGLSAIAIQARHPIQVLRLCQENGIRAILNHRPHPGAVNGHFTVLLDIDDKYVVLNDPALGPSRRLSHAELMQLWQPQSSASEILGNVVIGIAAAPPALRACEFCPTVIPAKVDCPRCNKAVCLGPAALLGCIRDGCIARMWNYIACPSCDFVWSFNEAGTSVGDLPRPAVLADAPSIPQPPNLDQLLAGLDVFCAQLLRVSGAEHHSDLTTQLDFIRSSKESLKAAQAKDVAGCKVRVDHFAAFVEESKKNAEAQQRREQELSAPPPPLDANALGQALLKNLWFQ